MAHEPNKAKETNGVVSTIPHLIRYIFQPLTDFLSHTFLPCYPEDRVQLIQTSLLRDGYLHCGVFILVADCINQIRRVLAPWLGAFLWRPAFSHFKFALSSPHFMSYALMAGGIGYLLARYMLDPARAVVDEKRGAMRVAEGEMKVSGEEGAGSEHKESEGLRKKM